MMKYQAQFVLLIILLLMGASVSVAQDRSPAAAFDEISVAKRPVQRGTIVGMSPIEVTMDVNRRKVSFPVNEIVRISYGLEPVELKTARRLANARRYDMALKRLGEIKLSEVSRDLISQDIAYYRAYSTAKLALGGRGDKDEAIKMLRAFISQHKNNYHHFAAVEVLGDLAVAVGQYNTASTFYDEVAKAPWPVYKLRATALEGRSLQARKKYAEALEKYEQVIDASKDIPGADEPKRLAILGKMAVLLATNSYPQKSLRPEAELHGVASFYYGDGGSCCLDFDIWQYWGIAGNITYVDAQVTTPGVTVTSLSGPVPGPGSQSPVLLSANSMRWYLPLPDGLFHAPQTVSACFNSIPASGAAITLIGYSSAGTTGTSGLQTTTITFGTDGDCGYLPDLWMKDTMVPDLPEDFGVEPNSVSQQLWISQDIWVRNTPDTLVSGGNYANEHQHQNPVYFNATTPNYVYVKVRNRGNSSNLGPEMLRVYWADASTGLPWPYPPGTGPGVWNEIDCMAGNIGVDPCPLPNINPGQDYVVQLPWVPPDPTGGTGHFCLVARIESGPWPPFAMATAEGPTLWLNVANNNNIAWKNVTVVTSGVGTRPNKVTVRNTLDHEAALALRFAVPARELRNHFLLHGDIFVDLGEAVMQKWRRGGQRARGFTVVGKTTIKITDPANAELGGLLFGAGEKQTVEVRMQLKPGARVPAGTAFNWDMIQIAPQRRNARPSPVGGERYIFTVPRAREEKVAGNR